MATNPSNELGAFHQFIGEKLRDGSGDISPEDALDQWRAEHPSPDEFSETVAAVRQALAEMDAGDCGIPLVEFDGKIRAKYGLPRRTRF